MIEIIAKDNATVQTVENRFPFGQQNKIKIHIQDDVIKSRLELKHTGQCLNECDNFFYYGYFNNEDDMKYVEYSDAYIHCASGIGDNTSRCLYVNILDTDRSYVKFKSDKNLKPDTKYTFSFLCTEKQLNDILITGASIDSNNIRVSDFSDGWYLYMVDSFTVDKDTQFSITIKDKGSEFYIDNVSLFESKNEVLDSANIGVEVKIINPEQSTTKMHKIINWYKTDDDIYVLLYVPPITVADYTDSIACKLNIFEKLSWRHKSSFGNITYTKDKDLIYQSNIFNLQGYILGVDLNLSVREL